MKRQAHPDSHSSSLASDFTCNKRNKRSFGSFYSTILSSSSSFTLLPPLCSSPPALSSPASMSSSPPSLLDLFDPWLVDILRFIDCKSLTRFGQTSHASHALTQEVIATTASSSSFLSSAPTLSEAFDDIVPLALSRMASPPSLVFLFFSPSYPSTSTSSSLSHLSSLLPTSVRLIGCHGIGVIGRDCHTLEMRELEKGEREKGVSMSFLHLPGVEVKSHFIDLKSIQLGVPSVPEVTPHWLSRVPAMGREEGQQWLKDAIGWKDKDEEADAGEHGQTSTLPPSFIVLSSPVTIVQSFLQCLQSLSPRSLITGAVASGGRGAYIGLFTKNDKGEIQAHTKGVAVLTMTPLPLSPAASTTSSSASSSPSLSSSSPSSPLPCSPSPPSPFSLLPASTGFASRGCKPCSAVYEVTLSSGEIIGEVREVRSLPHYDEEEDPLLHPDVLDRLLGQNQAQVEVEGEEVRLDELVEREQEVEGRVGSEVRDATPIEFLEVLRDVMSRSRGQDGYVNGLFIGLSDEYDSEQGRVLCDISEVGRSGIKVDTEPFRVLSSSSSSIPSLQGKFVQFFELDPAACMLDLANRLRPLSRPPSFLRSSLLFTCSGRGSAFFNHPRIDSGITAHQSRLGDVCGFFCNGEIGPPARSLQEQSWMRKEEEQRRKRRERERAGGDGEREEEQGSEEEEEKREVEASSQWTCEPATLQSFTAVVTLFNSQW